MADENAKVKSAEGDKNEKSPISGDTPAQEGASMGVSLLQTQRNPKFHADLKL